MTTDAERWKRIKAVFQDAAERPRPERAAYLDEACADDAALRREVESLLAADDAADDAFLEEGALEAVGGAAALEAIGNVSPGAPTAALPASGSGSGSSGRTAAAPSGSDAISLGSRLRELAQAAAATPLGRLVADRYRIEEELGRGGMGVVYRADDTKLRRPVAMKVLSSDLVRTDEWIERFGEEAQATAQLQHPGIVPIYDLGRDDAFGLFFTMKLVEGRTLTAVIGDAEGESGAPDAPTLFRLVQIVRELCRTVAYAHQRRVIHRDLKPENVMIGPLGEVLVMDWGLAKIRTSSESDGGTDAAVMARARASERRSAPVLTDRGDDGRTTRPGALVGTPTFMAPEQAGAGGEIGTATDVHAIGGILYYVLTGKPPFTAETLDGVLELVRTESVTPPRQLRPGVPRELEAIAQKALAKDPADRYATATALGDDVQSWLEGRPVDAFAEGPLRRAWKLILRHRAVAATVFGAVILINVGLVVALVVVDRQRRRADAGETEATRRRQEAEAALIERDHAAEARRRALARAYLERSRREADDGRIQRAALLAARAIEEDDGPTARGLLATLLDRLPERRWHRSLDDPPRRRVPWAEGRSAAVVIATGGGLVRVAPDSGADRAETTAVTWDAATAVSVSADGGRVAVATLGGVRVVDVASGAVVAFDDRPRFVNAIATDATGARVAFAATELSAGPDGGRPTPRYGVRLWDVASERQRILEADREEPIAALAWEGGRRLVVARADGTIRFIEISGEDARAVATVTLGADGVPFAPRALTWTDDGRWVAVGGEAGRLELVAPRVGEGQPIVRTIAGMGAGDVACVAFSPDGWWVAVGDARGEVHLVDVAAGRVEATLEAEGRGGVSLVDFVADGGLLVGTDEGALRIVDVDRLTGSSAIQCHRGAVAALALSSDGARLVSGDLDGRIAVHRRDGRSVELLGSATVGGAGALAAVGFARGALAARNEVEVGAVVWMGEEAGPAAYAPGVSGDARPPAWPRPGGSVRTAALDPGGAAIVSGGWDGAVIGLDVATGEVAELARLDAGIVALALAPTDDGAPRVAAVASDGTVLVERLGDGDELARFQHPGGRPRAVALGRGGALLAVGGHDGKVWLGRVDAGVEAGVLLEGHDATVTGLAFLPERRLLASASFDGTVRLWELASHRAIAVLHGPGGGIVSLAAGGADHLAAATEVGLAKVWSLEAVLRPAGDLSADLERRMGLALDGWSVAPAGPAPGSDGASSSGASSGGAGPR